MRLIYLLVILGLTSIGQVTAAHAQKDGVKKSIVDEMGIQIYKERVLNKSSDNFNVAKLPANIQSEIDNMMTCAVQRNRLSGRSDKLPVMIEFSQDFQLLIRHLDYYLMGIEKASEDDARKVAGALINSVPTKIENVQGIIDRNSLQLMSIGSGQATPEMIELAELCRTTVERTRKVEGRIKSRVQKDAEKRIRAMTGQEAEAPKEEALEAVADVVETAPEPVAEKSEPAVIEADISEEENSEPREKTDEENSKVVESLDELFDATIELLEDDKN